MSRAVWIFAGVAVAAFGGCGGTSIAGGTGGTGGLDGGAGSPGTGGTAGSGATDSGGASTGGTGGIVLAGGTGGIASTGGTGGIISTGGTGGIISTGGTGGVVSCGAPVPPQPACGAALCGNGKVDTCGGCPDGGWGGYPGGPGGPPCSYSAEDCDGTAFAGASCVSLGFKGGALGCSSTCSFDTTACVRCSAAGGHLAACDDSVAGAKAPNALAMAATAQQIGLAWISATNSGPEVWFARFKPDLSLIAKSGPIDAGCPSSVALATRPSGWDLATSGYGQSVEVFALDATGKVTQKNTVAQGSGAVFGERPGSTPLLAWINPSGKSLGAAVISADGASTSPPVGIPMPGGVVDGFVSSAFVVDGFLVAARESDRVVVGRVETDGTTTGSVTQPVPYETEVPALTGVGTEARMVYENFGVSPITVELVRLDHVGNPIASPVVVGAAPDYYNNAYPVAFGSGTVVVMGNYTGGVYRAQHLDAVRVDSIGTKVWGPRTIATDPMMMTGYGAVRSGTEVVTAFIESAGWGSGAGVGIARITP